MRSVSMQMALIADDVRAGDYASAGDRCEVLIDQMIEDGVGPRALDLWTQRLQMCRGLEGAGSKVAGWAPPELLRSIGSDDDDPKVTWIVPAVAS